MTQPPPIPPPPAFPPPMPPQRMEDNAGLRLLLPVGRSGLAIAAGYVGLVSVLVVPAPVALVLGIFAVRDILRSRKTPPRKYGLGRAIFGIVMGAIFSAVLVVLLAIFASEAIVKSRYR